MAIAFFFWYVSSNKNLIVLIFVLAMIAYVVNGITSVTTYFDMLTQQKRVVTSTDVAYFPEFSIESIGSQIGLASQIASAARLCSYLDWNCQDVISVHQKIG